MESIDRRVEQGLKICTHVKRHSCFHDSNKCCLKAAKLKHKDSFGKENFKKIKLVLHLVGDYAKYFDTNFIF